MTNLTEFVARLETDPDFCATRTPRALAYALSTLRTALADPRSRALYLFPLNALSQDQRRGYDEPRRRRSSSSKSIRAVTGSAAAIVTATRSPSS